MRRSLQTSSLCNIYITHSNSFHFLFHYPHMTPIYDSSFHFLPHEYAEGAALGFLSRSVIFRVCFVLPKEEWDRTISFYHPYILIPCPASCNGSKLTVFKFGIVLEGFGSGGCTHHDPNSLVAMLLLGHKGLAACLSLHVEVRFT